MNYPNLLSEGTIGRLSIRNRTVLAPMVTGYANYDGTPSEQLIEYFEERARGGVGLIITGATRVNNVHGVIIPRQLSMANDRHIEPFGAMAERVHALGAKLFCQLHHPGRQALTAMCQVGPMIEAVGRLWPGFYDRLPSLMRYGRAAPEVTDWYMQHVRWPAVVAPSDVPSELYNQRTRALHRWEIRRLVDDFVRAARRVQLSGADGVELHGAHGYLIQQFLSPHTNRRTDEYGGSLDNRMRFVCEIIEGIRRECGSDFPLAVRLSVDEYYREIGRPGQGIELEAGVEIARRLESAGVDALDVSSATYENSNYWLEPMSFEPGWRKHLARAVKEAVSVPVIAANLIRSPAQAEVQLADGTQDFVSLGRPLIADPMWPAKAAEGREDEIVRCISCLRCIESLEENAQSGRGMECAVNPRLGRERGTASPRRDGGGRRVAVVGAGPAGLSAAAVLADRGFETVVYERSNSAGGQLKLAAVPPGKDKIDWCIEDLQAAAVRSGARLEFNSEASLSRLEEFEPYAVVVATGAVPIVPAIPGVDLPDVCTVNDYLQDVPFGVRPRMGHSDGTAPMPGRRVAVIGSGLTGLEAALSLAEEGHRVTVVEMLKKIGPGVYFQNLDDVLAHLAPYAPEYVTSHALVGIGDGSVTLEHVKTRRRITRRVDNVVLAVGVCSDDRLAQDLRLRLERVVVVGDARRPGRIYSAIRSGFDAAFEL